MTAGHEVLYLSALHGFLFYDDLLEQNKCHTCMTL